jgi:hypothetical protein
MTTKNSFSSSSFEIIKAAARGMGPGEQVNINHEGCPSGEDIKGRLYIKVTDDGQMVLAFCHHCGQRTGIKVPYFGPHATEVPDRGYANKRWASGMEYFNTAREITMLGLHEYSFVITDSPLRYLYQEDTHEKMAYEKHYGIRYHDGNNCRLAGLVVPRYATIGLVGLDVRFTAKIASLKWDRYKRCDDGGNVLCGKLSVYNTSGAKTCVLCEDPISAIKLDMAGYAGVALMGTDISSEDILKLSYLYDRLVVWLDNDSDPIKEKAEAIYRRALMFISNTNIIRALEDPKKYSLDAIRSYLE